MPTSQPTVRQAWISLFTAFMVLQAILVGVGIFFATGGQDLARDPAERLDAMRQVFQSIAAIGVIAVMVLTRAKLHPDAIESPQDLFRGTIIVLMVGELTVALALIGLSKLHLAQFLVAAGMVFLADFVLVLPAGLRALGKTRGKNGSPGNNRPA